MNILSVYNSDKGCVSIRLNTNLLEKYYVNLKGLIRESSVKVLGVSREGKDTMIIDFPISSAGPISTSSVSGADTMPSNSGGPVGMSVGVDKEQFNSLIEIINRFVDVAVKKELKNLEFCPLEGYPVENFKEDVLISMKHKRSLMFIDTYQSYLDVENSVGGAERHIYNQYEVPYGSDEWAEAVTLINTDKFEELREWIRPLLKKTVWV